MEISSTYSEATQFMPASLTVTMTGEIVPGDAATLKAELLRYQGRPINDISFEFDSPGGALMEGIRIGHVIAARPESTSSRIAGSSAPICASACVYAYIGSDFRFIEDVAELGVHQFYTQDELTGSDALAMGQELTSIILIRLCRRGRGPQDPRHGRRLHAPFLPQRAASSFDARCAATPHDAREWVGHPRCRSPRQRHPRDFTG